MKNRTKKVRSAAPPSTSRRRQHILVPFDFSDGAKLALRHAITQARQSKARLTLLHIVHLPYLGIGFGPGEGLGAEAGLIAEATKQLSAFARAAKRQGVPVNAMVRIGHPVSDVVSVAQNEGSELIIMGTHGRTGLKHTLLGSVAEGVLRHAPCPVLVVRDRARSPA